MPMFLLLILSLIALVMLILAMVLLRRSTGGNETTSRNQQNVTIYRQELAALDAQRGENGLNDEEYAALKRELDQKLLGSIGENPDAPAHSDYTLSNRILLLALLVLLPVLSLNIYALIGDGRFASASNMLGSSSAMTQGVPPNAMPGANADVDINAMVTGLENKLEEDPNNVQGWEMLGRSYMVLGRYADAVDVYQRLLDISPDDPTRQLAFADAAMMEGSPANIAQADVMIDAVLAQSPDNAMALWLHGERQYEKLNYQQALDAWQRVQALLPPNAPERESLQERIDMVKQNLAQ